MGSTGAIIMGFFGSVFCICGLGPVIGWKSPALLLPIAIVAWIVWSVVVLSRKGSAKLRSARATKAILWSTIGEGIGIFVVINALLNLGHQDLILPGISLVVGLHFLPIAYAIPFRAFYAVAAALLFAATAGFVFHQPSGSAVAGIVSAAALWVASFAALRREARALAS